MAYLLNHLLTESAARNPDSPALRYEGAGLSYGEVEERSNRIAQSLREVGVVPGDRVGLHMKKTAEAVMMLFGILKSGACVVPVGKDMPLPRIRHIVEQCEMRYLVASNEALEHLGGSPFDGTTLDCILIAGPGSEAEGSSRSIDLAAVERSQSADPLAISTVDCDLAYVLFTSGSTGRPKGVMLSHRAVLSFVNWAGDEFSIRADDRLSNHASLGFDLSTFDIHAGMRAGASVTIIREGLSAFPARLAELIELERITVWYSVPSVLTMLTNRGGLAKRRLDALRLVLFAGEVFPVKHLRELMRAAPGARYFNLYGPTETNVCTYYEVVQPPTPDARPIPIGRACANTRTVVLDEEGHPVTEPGSEGLLFVGGSNLMAGYYGRPQETEAAFRPDPLVHGREERLYDTGDWVKIADDGNYLFLGRRDHMVKVGGYRIELGEIEIALHSCPGVAEAAAVVVADDVIGDCIQAVVVPTDSRLDAQTVKRHCTSLLPQYMVPRHVLFKEELPRTATDKIDRPALANAKAASTDLAIGQR